MRLSEIFKFVKQKSGRDLKLIGKFTDGFRNDVFKVSERTGEKFVLIVYKNEKNILWTINNAHSAAKFLSKHLPTRVPIEISPGEHVLKLPGSRYIALYNHLDGTSIPWDAYERRHLKSIGKTLSEMHFLLKNFDGANLPDWKAEILLEVKSMTKYFEKVSPWIEKKLRISINEKQYEKILAEFENFLKTALNDKNFPLHYDFVRGNILFSGKILLDDTCEITGILDFEKVCNGPHIADIARTLSFLIVDCKYKSETEVVKWFLQRGYVKRGRNKTQIPADGLETFLQIFWLRDFYKFLLHNPYESLPKNEHYLRTRDKLIERKLLTSLKVRTLH